jgi:uncharacterized protein (TIGR04222 family)
VGENDRAFNKLKNINFRCRGNAPMLNADQINLYQRLQDFALDDPTHEFGFTRHLMKNHGWTLTYTQRAIEEYKKFAFLTVVANHQVVPSDAVDQVWHAHVLLTQSYWEEFCPKVLGKSLHHHPAKGGRAERAEFHNLYAQTIASYHQFFGSPPVDIWSPPDRRFGSELKMQRVNLNDNWVIPKKLPQVKLFQSLYFSIIISVLMIGCVNSNQGSNFGEWIDSKTIYKFSTSFGIPILLGLVIRYLIRKPSQQAQKPQLDHYQVAYLAGGKTLLGIQRSVDLAIVQLVHHGYLRPNVRNRTFAIEKRLPTGIGGLERYVMQQVQKTPQLQGLRSNGVAQTAFLQEHLIQEKLMMSFWAGLLGWSLFIFISFTLSFIFLGGLIGVILQSVTGMKMALDLHIVTALWQAVGITTVCCCIPSGRTRWGDRILADLRKNHDAYDVAQRFALYDYEALSGGALDDLRQIFHADAVEKKSDSGGCGC